MPKPLASIVGPIHDLPFAIQCHHATLYWLAQAQFEAPFVTVRSGQPYDAANPGKLVARNYLTMPGLPIVPLLV